VSTLRILHTESSLELGGQEYATLALVEGLRRRGHDVILLVQPGSQLERTAGERGIPCRTVTMHKTAYPWAILRVCSIIRKCRIDIVHTHGSRDSWIGSLAASCSSLKPAVVLTRHKTTPIAQHVVNRMLYHRLVDRIVTTGGALTRQHLLVDHGFPETHVVAIPTGADVDRFTPEVKGSGFRKAMGIDEEECLIGTVCFLRSYKGLDHFVEAASIISKRIPRSRFIIVGDGPEKPHVKKKIAQCGLQDRCMLPGYWQAVPEVMAALDVFVVSSTTGETLTQTIPQALATETPVVATNIGGIPDIIRHGQTGFLVPPGDAEALAQYILELIQNPEQGVIMAREGRKLVLESFSSASTVRKNESLYQELLQERQKQVARA